MGFEKIMDKLLLEIRRIRQLSELQNTELKVQMKQGAEYLDVATKTYGNFTGDEIGKFAQEAHLFGDVAEIQLDDGRLVLTPKSAVEQIQNVLDSNTKDDFINVGTNDNGTYAF